MVRYVVVAPRSGEMAAWLRCNDVDPADVPFSSEVFVEVDGAGVWVVRHAFYERSDGAIRYDAVVGGPVCGERSVVLVSDPPMSWLRWVGDGGVVRVPEQDEGVSGDECVADGAHNCD